MVTSDPKDMLPATAFHIDTFGIKTENKHIYFYYSFKQLVKCDSTNTNGLSYNDIDTFKVLYWAQLGGRKCIISSTIASKRESLVSTIG